MYIYIYIYIYMCKLLHVSSRMEKLKEKLPLHVYDALIDAQFKSLSQIIALNKTELAQIANLNLNISGQILKYTSEIILSGKLCTANQIPSITKISTGCSSIDLLTNGGIALCGITEIGGCSGVGKTQLCLQLSLVTQLPKSFGGVEGSVVYICTEDAFPIRRLNELASSFYNKYGAHVRTSFEDNIFIEHVADFEQLKKCLFTSLPKLLTAKKVGLLVIDSIAGLFRSENVNVNYMNRSRDFRILVSHLNKLSSKHNFAVVCINQVVDNIETGITEPCLGLSWSNMLSYRLNINRYLPHLHSSQREIEVMFGPDLPNASATFQITQEGLIGI